MALGDRRRKVTKLTIEPGLRVIVEFQYWVEAKTEHASDKRANTAEFPWDVFLKSTTAQDRGGIIPSIQKLMTLMVAREDMKFLADAVEEPVKIEP